jgi:hypothetical protein
MSNFINKCPCCGGKLVVTGFLCRRCGTKISGEFEFPSFPGLTKDEIEFVKTFVKCRGNIKEVEKELGISYPTVRNRLDEVIRDMGFRIERSDDKAKILDRLESGEISVDTAVRLLSYR